MTTAADLIEETKAIIYSGQEPEANRLASSVNTGDTSMTFSFSLGSISRGAIISIGLEDIRVWSTSGTTTADIVERGVNGTSAASHNAGDYVGVRPKFSDFRILRALNQDLADLSSPVNGLFRVGTVDLTYNPAVQGYDLDGVTRLIDVLELRWKQAGPSKKWPVIRNYSIGRDMDTDEFASTLALMIDEPAYPGFPIHVRYSTDFTAMTALTDDVTTDAGLPVSAVDLPPIGAAIRLVAGREIGRNFIEAQTEPKRAEDVPPGAILQSTRELHLLRLTRIQAEAARLQKDWPKYR